MGAFRTRLARTAAAILLSGATVAPAAAATRTWVGPNGGQWSVAVNWNENAVPADGDDLVFSALGSAASNNDLTITVNSISLSTSHGIFCGSNELGLTAGITGSIPGVIVALNCTVRLAGPQTWTVVDGSAASVILDGNAWTLAIEDIFDPGIIDGAGAIAKNGPGTLRLWDSSSFSGPMTIDAGIVEARHPNALGVGDQTSANGTTVAAGASLIIVASGGPFTLAAEALTLQGTGVGNLGALQLTGSDPIDLHGQIDLAATTHIRSDGPPLILWTIVKGPGDLIILDNTNVMFGTNQNTLTAIGFAGAGAPVISQYQPNTFANMRINLTAGATLELNDVYTEVAGLDGAGTVKLGPSTGQLIVKNTLPSTFTGTISGVGGSVYKDGPGTLTLGGANTFSIGPLIIAGTLRVTHPEALGLADGTANTGTSVLEGATLALDGVAITNLERIHLGGDTMPATLQVMGTNPSSIAGPLIMTQQVAVTGTNGATLTVSGEVQGVTPFSITNAALLIMSSTGGFGQPITVNAGGTFAAGANGVFNSSTKVVLNGGTFGVNGKTVTLGSLSGTGVVAFGTNGSLHVSTQTEITLAATSTGTGTFRKSGAALTLSGPFAVTGNVTLSSGPLIIAHNQALVGTPRVTVNSPGSLRYMVAATVPYQVIYNGTGGAEDAGAVQVLGGDVTFTGPFGPGGFHDVIRVNAPHVMTWASPITTSTLQVLGTGTAVFGAANNTLTLLRIGLTPFANTPTGPTTVKVGVAGALNPFDVTIGVGSTFDLNGFDQTVKYLGGDGTMAIGAQKLTVQSGSQFPGILTGTGSIDVTGDRLELSGTSTFSGTVTAKRFGNSGTLPASVHVTEDSLFLLPNSVTGPVSVAPTATLNPGGNPFTAGTATSGSVTVPAGARYAAEVHNQPLLKVNGTVTLGGELYMLLHPTVSVPGDSLTLIDNDGTDPVVGMFSNQSEGTTLKIAEVTYRISYMGGTGNDVTLTKQEAIYFLSEGATGEFFDTDLLIANPHAETAAVQVELYKENGELKGFLYNILPKSRITIRVDELEGMESATFSTVVRSVNTALNLVVERTMRWDATGYGAHTEKATSGPALKWYFAEGSEGFFRTYLLLANPDFVPSTATVTYLREGGEPPLVRTYELQADSRRTIQAADDPELVGRSFGITVEFTRRGIAERAMYFGESPIWKGGHESLGETQPSQTWFLAEGATGAGFDTFILVANPNAEPADVTYTFPVGFCGAGDDHEDDPGPVAAHGEHRSGRPADSGWCGGDADQRDASGDCRARAVLAALVRQLDRGAQQLRRHRSGHEVGPRRRPRGRAGELSDLHPARERGHRDRARAGAVPWRRRFGDAGDENDRSASAAARERAGRSYGRARRCGDDVRGGHHFR